MSHAPGIPAYPITAWSVCTALGVTTAETVAGLSEGRSGLRPPPVELPFATVCGALPCELAAPAPSFAGYDSPVARIAMQLLDEVSAAVDAAARRWGAGRVAVILGTSVGGLAVTERALERLYAEGALPADYDLRKRHSLHGAVDLVAARAGLRGPRYALSTACSSSTKVFAAAQRLLRAGVVDAALVGGVDSLCQTTLRGFHSLSVLSPVACRPFGLDREGMNLGEGGGLFLLEREGDARARLLGVGESADAFHMSSPHPEGEGARAAMLGALAQAGLSPSEVDHVNAHGTGTPKNDAVEARVLRELFGPDLPVSSTKAATGHTLGAAGAVEAAFAVVAVEQGWIPASLRAEPLDPEARIHVNLTRRAMRCRAVMSNSFGFGGSNASVLVGAA